MKKLSSRSVFACLCTMFLFSLMCITPLYAVDGTKWDGKKYIFKLLDPTQTNSESNPFIIDTAGKLAYLAYFANNEFDLESIGREMNLKGLNFALVRNYFKLTADLDMNGSKYEWVSMITGPDFFDGGGHVISNLRISDTTTPPFLDPDNGLYLMQLGLFQTVGTVKNLTIGKGSTVTYTGFFKKKMVRLTAASIACEAEEISNCSSDAVINIKYNGDTKVAGIAAIAKKVSNCTNRGEIIFKGDVLDVKQKNVGRDMPGYLFVAGVCAEPQKLLTNCTNSGNISIKASGDEVNIGGIASIAGESDNSELTNSGKIQIVGTAAILKGWVGGLFGMGNTTTRITKTATLTNPGQILNTGAIDVSLPSGKIHVGGISGGNDGRPDFSSGSAQFGGAYGFINACNKGSLTVASTGKALVDVGGIVGTCSMVFNCYSTGAINVSTGSETVAYVGGLAASNIYAQNSYSISPISVIGSGKNNVGGLIGDTRIHWSDTTEKDRKYTVMNVCWLHQSQEGGINNLIPYAKGTYEGAKDSCSGNVYQFESPDATTLVKSDDEAGRRQDYDGTLLSILNQGAADHTPRLYRMWKIDDTNNGYPVFE